MVRLVNFKFYMLIGEMPPLISLLELVMFYWVWSHWKVLQLFTRGDMSLKKRYLDELFLI